MRAVALALRGLWWRRSASLVIGFVAVVCTAVAAAGPAYGGAARDAVVQSTLRDAPADTDGTGLSVSRAFTGKVPDAGPLGVDVTTAFAGVLDHGPYAAPVLSILSNAHVVDASNGTAVTTPIAYRDDVCAHLVIVTGSCSEAKGAALISASTARDQGWQVGTVLPFIDFGPKGHFPALTVRGVYRPVDPDGPYWFDGTHGYFSGTAVTDAVFIGTSSWTSVPPGTSVALYADLALLPSSVHDGDLTAFTKAVQVAASRLRDANGADGASDLITTSLPSVVFSAQRAADQVSGPVASIVAQLLVLTFAVLFLLMVGSHESRGSEVALGKLRGLSTRAAVAHALLEPTILLAAAVPLGVGVATLVLHTAAPSVVGSDTTIAVGPISWLAAIAAGAAGVLAGLAASISVLRRPVLAQWQRTERRPRRVGWIVEAVVVVLALAATSQLLGKNNGSGRFAFLPSAAPALLAVAFALIGARVLPLAARAGFAVTRGSRFVGAFVALRQLARRRGGLRSFGVVCVAVALVVFGLCSHVVFQANRQARARADVGASRVVLLQPSSVGTDIIGIVDRLDPSRTQATAVYQGSFVKGADDDLATGGQDFAEPQSSVTPTLLVVDPVSFARVATWSTGYGGAKTLAATVDPLVRQSPHLVRFTGTTLRVAGTVRSSSSLPVVVQTEVTDRLGRATVVTLGTVQPTAGRLGAVGPAQPFDFTVKVAQCNDGCLFRRLSVVAQPQAKPPLTQKIDFSTVAAGSNLLPDLLTSSWQTFGGDISIIHVGNGLEISVAADDPSGDAGYGFGGFADVPDATPGLVTTTQESAVPGGNVAVSPAVGVPFDVGPSLLGVLPRAGDAGVLLTRDALAATQPEGYAVFAPNQVWLSAAAPADFPERLAAAGLVVSSVESVSDRAATLARQGPSLAVAALGFGAAAAALLAVAGAVATFVVASRRRLYELAALRALGLKPRRIWSSVALEQVATAVVAAAFGAAAGLLGARIALQALPEFGDDPTFPPLLVNLPVGWSALAAAAVALAVAVVTGLLGVGLVRRADTSRLRETQG